MESIRRKGPRLVKGADAGESPERQSAQRAIDQVRAENMRALSRRLDRVLHAATWLIGLSIRIRKIRIDRHATVITIENTPFVWRLFAGDCAWRERRTDGDVDRYTWFAVRYGVRIEWEEQQWRG